MEFQLSVVSDNDAIKEIKAAEILEELNKIDNVKASSTSFSESLLKERLTGLEVFATFLASAACVQIAKAIRDFVRRNSVKVVLQRSDGSTLNVEVTGSDPEWVGKIEEFLQSTTD